MKTGAHLASDVIKQRPSLRRATGTSTINSIRLIEHQEVFSLFLSEKYSVQSTRLTLREMFRGCIRDRANTAESSQIRWTSYQSSPMTFPELLPPLGVDVSREPLIRHSRVTETFRRRRYLSHLAHVTTVIIAAVRARATRREAALGPPLTPASRLPRVYTRGNRSFSTRTNGRNRHARSRREETIAKNKRRLTQPLT